MFDVFLETHHARLNAVSARADVAGIAVAGRSFDYPWAKSDGGTGLQILFPGSTSAALRTPDLRHALFQRLDALNPTVVFIPGWSSRAARLALLWTVLRRRQAVMMCDSTAADTHRNRVKEALKRVLLKACAAAFVSGARSARYVRSLGVPLERIHQGYDAVDNDHFSSGAVKARADAARVRAAFGLPERYLLTVCRLVPKKNVATLLKAYAQLRDRLPIIPDLVIAGEGHDRSALQDLAQQLQVAARVHFLGHVGYAELPAVYGLAEAFVLASISEPWGLVANEAAAAGLPLLLSQRSGASEDLVIAGRNGWIFDAGHPAAITDALYRLVTHPDRASLAQASGEIAATWSLDRFAQGFLAALETAQKLPRAPPLGTSLLLGCLAYGQRLQN